MKTKVILAAVAMILAPTVTLAQGCNYDKINKQAASCVAGTSWDAEKGACVATPTG